MPYKLVAPRPGRAWTTFRVRGTENGVYLDRSTGTSDRKIAQRRLVEWKMEAQTTTPRKAHSSTFAEAAIAYMQSGGERKFLAPLLTHFGEAPLASIGQLEIDAAATSLYPNGASATRNRQVYTPISAIIRHVGHTMVLKRPKGAQGTPRTAWLQPEEAKRLLGAAGTVDARLGALCAFLLYTGCRLGEGLKLEWKDIDLERQQALILQTKNGKPRWVHLTPGLVGVLGALPRDRTRVFGLGFGNPLYRLLSNAVRTSGVDIPEGVAFHIFRHTWGTWMRQYGGLDTVGLMATGAWRSRHAAEGYMHASTTAEARKADLLPTWE
jgi:integrase